MGYEWQLSTPQAEGMDERILNQIDDYLKQQRYRLVNSILVVKNGKLVFERYYNQFQADRKNNIKSVWKSILAITTGICLAQGLIGSLDDPICKYLPQFAQNIHPYHRLITMRSLLTMSSGIYWNGGIHYHCPMLAQMLRSSDWISYIADIAMSNLPGTNFQYKEWDVILLAAVIGRASEGTAYDVVSEYLYQPLDIKSGKWPQGPGGISYTAMKGEEDSNLSARDLAKIGSLFLNHGLFEGKPIIAADFVAEAIRPSFSNVSLGPSMSNTSYGYLWWLFPDGYGCRGSGGQEVNVLPEQNFISVIQATPTSSSKAYPDIHENILKKAIIHAPTRVNS
ncbi:MAG TPA: serine hydrolase [Bacillota bacterium]|nr:serine hydrolase [Bacillota bacterium]